MPGPCLPVPGENENHCLKVLDILTTILLLMNLIILCVIKLKQRNDDDSSLLYVMEMLIDNQES